ncbi:MAG TPA: hypothetical protein DG753_12115 [Clostridium sp.]|nr:hypothetical protein [Clostridium sp.]
MKQGQLTNENLLKIHLIKKFKSLICILGVILMMSSINGCFFSGQDPDELRGDMLKFVNEKYGMEFIPTYFAMDDGVAQLVVYPKGGDREKDNFKVGWDKNKKTGKYEYKDSYSAIMMAPKYKEKIEELLKPYFENYSVEVRANMCVLPNDFGVDDDFQKVINKKIEYAPHVTIKVARSSDDIDDFNKKVDEFINDVSNNKINGYLLIAYLTGIDLDHEIISYESYEKERYFIIDGIGEKYNVYESEDYK